MSSIILSVLVVAAGVALGLARGGRLDAVLAVRPRWWGLVAGGFLLQALVETVDVPQDTSLWIIGTFLLVVGLMANAAIAGSLIVATGVSMNLLSFVLNGAQPIRFEALEPAGLVDAGTTRDQVSAVGRLLELETSSTKLGFLGDTIPIGFLGMVISLGDVVTFAGVIVVVAGVLAAPRRVGVDIDALFATPAPLALDLEMPTAPVDEAVLDLAADAPTIDIGDGRPAPVAVDLTADAYDPDDLWADDDTGIRILGPKS